MLEQAHPHLKQAITVFVITLIVVIGLASFSYAYMDTARDSKAAAQRAMKIWENRVSSSRHSNSIIDAYEADYLQLINNGVIGPEHRLSWYETVQATSEARGMPSVKYSVSSQMEFNPQAVSRHFKGVELYRSSMSMDIKMSHEGDLFALLNNLQNRARGLFVVDKCEIERLGSKAGVQADINNMKAYCELSWYTIRAKKAGQG